jgi:hypothetical protein
MIGKSMRAVQTLMITSITHHQQRFSMRNTKVNGGNNAWGGMAAYLGETLKQGWRCAKSWFVNACPLLNNPRYIFIVQRLSILSKLDSNNPYHICAEL